MKREDLCPAVRAQLRRLPPPFEAHYGVVPLPPPREMISIDPVVPALAAASMALGRVEALSQELGGRWLISRILPRREAVSSSSIEGTNSTLDQLLSAEETENENVTNDARQVRDYALTLDELLPQAQQQGGAIFVSDLVQDLHRAVMRGDAGYQDTPGDFRQRVVWIGGSGDIAYSTYNPAPPENIAPCLGETMAYMRGDDVNLMTQSLITRMAVAHAHFEAVHPFRDGNGRVGRLLLPLMMAAEGHIPLYLSPYIAAHRDVYYEALKMAQQRLAWHHLIGFLAAAITGTVDEMLVTRQALQGLAQLWVKRRAFRRGSAALKALAVLQDYPVLTIKRLTHLADVSFPAATTAIGQLIDANILTERTGYARNRVFVATEILQILNRPYAEAPILPDQ